MAPRDPSPRDPRPARPREPGDAPRRDPARRFGPSSTRAATPQAPPAAPPEPPLDRPPPDQPSRLRRGDLPPRDAPPRETPPRDRAEAPRRPARPEPREAPVARPARPERDEPTARTPSGARDPRPDRPRPSRPAPPPVDDEPPRRPAWPMAWRREPGAAPDAPPRRGRGPRVVLTVLSVLVFALSGSAWAALSGSISTSNNAIGFTGDAADGATDILLVGVDSRTDAQGRPLPRDVLREIGAGRESGVVNTDTMILVRIPNDGSRAVAFSIPRDSYVSIPGAGRRDKINSAYPGAKAEAAQELVSSGVTDPREVDVRSSEAGRSELVKSVAQLTGLTVDHFAEVNLLGFYNLTNAIGGVNVCLKAKTDDDLSGAHFRAGPQSISGHDALAFVRQRHGLPQGDLDRIRRQQAFLAGLSNKVLSAGTLADPFTLSRLLGAVKESVVLDGGWDVLRFAQQMQGVSAGNVAFLTIPTEGTDTVDGRGDVVRVDPPAVQRFVADAIGPDDAKPEDDAPAPGTIPIDIRNASGTEGAAARVVAVLTAQGYAKATSGNADDPSRASAVLFGPGADAAGGRVATSLGGLPTRFDPAVAPGTVRVLLASDYRGPGAAAPAPFSSGRASVARAPAPPPAPAITADGVPCIA